MTHSAHITEFEVSNVEPANKLLSELPYFEAMERLLTPPSEVGDRQKPQRKHLKKEACANYQDTLVGNVEFHPVISALHKAYHDHRPLCLSPDTIWLMICQGLANHINVHAERLRPLLVKHQEKLKITVRRDDFIKGANDNLWTEVFSAFSATIREHIGEKTHDLIMPDFSTTGLVEKAAAEIVLMDAVQSYFEYKCCTLCGIPRIKLEGTLDDWQVLLNRTKDLACFELEWWINPLLPILEQFIAAVQGNPDQSFWQSIYKMNNGSGGPYITGWIIAFFPYLKDWTTQKATQQNESLIKDEEALRELLYPSFADDRDDGLDGLTTMKFPSGLSTAPFVWQYYEQAYEMEFLGGFVGIRQNSDDFFLRPEIGWAVYEVIWNYAIDVDDEEKNRLLAKADGYLATGHYQQAEQLMLEAIENNRKNSEFALKLLEVCCASNNMACFADCLNKIHLAETFPDLSFWRKVVEMGENRIPNFPGSVLEDKVSSFLYMIKKLNQKNK